MEKKKKTPRHQFILRLSDDVYKWLEEKAEELEISKNAIIAECIKQRINSEINTRKIKEKYDRKNIKTSFRINASKTESHNKKLCTVGLWISDNVHSWIEVKAEEYGISRDQIVSESIKQNIKLEINARQKREEYHRKKNLI